MCPIQSDNLVLASMGHYNANLRFEQPDIVGYTTSISVQELVLEKGTSTPSLGRGKGSVHVNETTGVIKVKTICTPKFGLELLRVLLR